MKTSLEWLKQYTDIPWSVSELAESLTMAGLEVEGISSVGEAPGGCVVCEILSSESHPNADRLRVCRVSTGAEAPLQIVCGAPNCDVGSKVPLATIGTVLGEDFEVSKVKLRGVESFGMMCSEAELGLGHDESGLMILPSNAPVGALLADVIASDTVVDWEVTPNRPDWLSHLGIAREIAALPGSVGELRMPAVDLAEASGFRAEEVASVEVKDPELCPRYIAMVLRNVEIASSPDWMQRRLESVGVRPINNVVDITNYVLLECGQPLHAFDHDRLTDGAIIVRRAEAGETLTTLDGNERILTEDNLLIADPSGGVALAGVMGGADSEINEGTETVLLESAAFNPANIRATSRDLGLSTEASYRFERGVGLEMVEFAARRAASLICELAGGELAEGMIDVYSDRYEPHSVTCNYQKVSRVLGVEISPEEVTGSLKRLGLDVVDADNDSVTVDIPSFRLDLRREIDLIEEVARVHGLDSIPAEPAPACVDGLMEDDQFYPLQEAREQLLSLGLDETMTSSFVSIGSATSDTGICEDELIKPINPLSLETACMRPSLIPGLIQTLAHNVAHGTDDLAIFELGTVMSCSSDSPEERHQVGIILSGRPHPERFGEELGDEVDFYDMKGILEGWFEARRQGGLLCCPAEHPAFAAEMCAEFAAEDNRLAVFGRVCEELTAEIRLNYPVFMAIIELERLMSSAASSRRYLPLPQYPAVARDISFLASTDLSNQEVIDVIESVDCPFFETVQLFDIYEDQDALGENLQSLAYSLVYRDPEGTLTDDQVNAMHEKIRSRLVEKLAVELR